MIENGSHGTYVAEAVRDIIAEYFGMNIQEINEDVSAVMEVEALRQIIQKGIEEDEKLFKSFKYKR